MEAVAAGGSGAVWVEELALWVAAVYAVAICCWFCAAKISGGGRLGVTCQWFRAVCHGALLPVGWVGYLSV